MLALRWYFLGCLGIEIKTCIPASDHTPPQHVHLEKIGVLPLELLYSCLPEEGANQPNSAGAGKLQVSTTSTVPKAQPAEQS